VSVPSPIPCSHLSTIVDAQVVIKDVKYHTLPDGRPATDRVDLRCLFVNKTTDEIIPVNKVIFIVDKHGLDISGDLPVLAIRENMVGLCFDKLGKQDVTTN
jgi:hypothetical protein